MCVPEPGDGGWGEREVRPLTQVVPLVFGVIVDVFLAETAEEYAVETGVESVQVGPTDVADTRLGLWVGRTKGHGQCGGKRIKQDNPPAILLAGRRKWED